jgi:hypothetical protein
MQHLTENCTMKAKRKDTSTKHGKKPATAPDAITFHNEQKAHPWHRLPFVKVTKPGVSDWHVPQAGNYTDNVDIGEAMAVAYMEYLRGINPNQRVCALQHVVISMFKVHAKATPKQRDALRAHAIGFFHLIGTHLVSAVKHAPKVSEQAIIAEANRALAGDGITKRMFAERQRTQEASHA